MNLLRGISPAEFMAISLILADIPTFYDFEEDESAESISQT